MMDFSAFLLQLIEQGEFLWISLSFPHLYSAKCLQSTHTREAENQGTSNQGWPDGRRGLPVFSIGVKCAHTSTPFPEPMSQQPLHRERFAPGTAQIGFVTSLGVAQGHPSGSCPGHGYGSAASCRHRRLPWGSVSTDGTRQVPRGDPAPSGCRCCHDRTSLWDWLPAGRSRGGQVLGAGGPAEQGPVLPP